MAWTYTLDTATPSGATQPVSILDDSIQELKKALQERLNADHMMELTGTQVSDTDAGKHRKVTFYGVLATKPTLEAGEGALYVKTVSGLSELFYEDSDGTEKQLTSGGTLNIAAADIANDLIDEDHIQLTVGGWLAGANTDGDGEVELIESDGESPILGAGAKTYSTGAPTHNQHVSNKKYVDDQVAAKGAFLDGTTVFNTHCTAGNTWQDLDLSAQVGASATLVFLEVTGSYSGSMYMAVKPKGYGSSTFANHYSSGPLGAAETGVGSGKYGYLVCMTDASGVVQIGASLGGNAAYAFTIKLIGYVK